MVECSEATSDEGGRRNGHPSQDADPSFGIRADMTPAQAVEEATPTAEEALWAGVQMPAIALAMVTSMHSALAALVGITIRFASRNGRRAIGEAPVAGKDDDRLEHCILWALRAVHRALHAMLFGSGDERAWIRRVRKVEGCGTDSALVGPCNAAQPGMTRCAAPRDP